MWDLVHEDRSGRILSRIFGIPGSQVLQRLRRLPCRDGDRIALLAPDDTTIDGFLATVAAMNEARDG